MTPNPNSPNPPRCRIEHDWAAIDAAMAEAGWAATPARPNLDGEERGGR